MKVRNEYLAALGDLYERTPKAVLGAIVVSWAIRHAECSPDDAPAIVAEVMDEWRALKDNGIVTQRPAKLGG